jgi:hypothetical protein
MTTSTEHILEVNEQRSDLTIRERAAINILHNEDNWTVDVLSMTFQVGNGGIRRALDDENAQELARHALKLEVSG